jgi:hypothetical protein
MVRDGSSRSTARSRILIEWIFRNRLRGQLDAANAVPAGNCESGYIDVPRLGFGDRSFWWLYTAKRCITPIEEGKENRPASQRLSGSAMVQRLLQPVSD